MTIGSPSRFFSARRGRVIGSGPSRPWGTVVWGVADIGGYASSGWLAPGTGVATSLWMVSVTVRRL